MKPKKKASLSIHLVAIISLVIFLMFFIAILLNIRGCSSQRLFDDSVDEIAEVIERAQKTDGYIETLEIYIGPESMIVAYFPGYQNVITRYEAKLADNLRIYPARTTGFTLGADYTFPRDEGILNGTLQDTEGANFLGYIKRRPSDCPTNAFCICECMQFDLVTNERSIYNSKNAHITCGTEKCKAIPNINVDDTIYLKDFIKHTNKYEEKEDDEEYATLHPQPHTIHWVGGFIIPRTTRYELNEMTKQVCYIWPSTYYARDGGCFGVLGLEDKVFLEQRLIIAGHLHNYVADFLNLKITNTANKLSFELI